MFVETVLLYFTVALVSALTCAFIRGYLAPDVFIANVLLGSVCAWIGGVMFGAVGPVVVGIPVLACFAIALPTLFGFNAIFAPHGRATATGGQIIELKPATDKGLRRAS